MKRTLLWIGISAFAGFSSFAQTPFDATFNGGSTINLTGASSATKILAVTNETYLAGATDYQAWMGTDHGIIKFVDNDPQGSATAANYADAWSFGETTEAYVDFKYHGTKVLALGHANSWGGPNPSKIFLEMRKSALDNAFDSTFASSGLQIIAESNKDLYADALAVQQDGKIMVGGYLRDLSTNARPFLMIRLNPNGSLDNTFGTGGFATHSFLGFLPNCMLSDLQVLSSGKYLISGYELDSANSKWNGILARINSNGTVDNTFGTNGFVRFAEGPMGTEAESIALNADGAILVAVNDMETVPAPYNVSYDLRIVKLTVDGVVDSTFASNGIFALPSLEGHVNSKLYKIDVLPNGKIVGGGHVRSSFSADFYSSVMLLTSAGALDPSFDNNGIYFWNYRGGPVTDFTYQSNGKLAYMENFFNGNENFAVAGRLVIDPNAVSMDTPAPLAMEMYPNPAGNAVNVSLSQEESVSIFALDGRLVHASAAAFNHNIDLSGLAKGVYVVRAGNAVKRLVKE